MTELTPGEIAERLSEAGTVICRSCGPRFPVPATRIANAYARKEGNERLDWPLCESHLPYAMILGWFPIRKIDEAPPFNPDPWTPNATTEGGTVRAHLMEKEG